MYIVRQHHICIAVFIHHSDAKVFAKAVRDRFPSLEITVSETQKEPVNFSLYSRDIGI